MLKEQGIREYLNKKDIAFNENSSIIGVIFPSKFTYALYSGSVVKTKI